MQTVVNSLTEKIMLAMYGPVTTLEDIGTYILPDGREWSSGRDLYEYLQLAPSQLTRWCNNNIEKNPFASLGTDYECFDIHVETGGGRKVVTEYAVHPDFAAKLSMVSRSPRAEEVRNFFVARNKKLAAVEQAAMSAAPTLPQSQAELILMIAQQGVATEQRLAAQEKQLASVEQQVAEIAAKQNTIDTNYYTVSAWASKQGMKKSPQELNGYGRRASALSKEQGYSIGRVHDAKYVTVGTYHVDILKQVFVVPTTAVVRVVPQQPRARA